MAKYCVVTPHSWSMSCQKATSFTTNYIQFFSFLWAFTWYNSWKEGCGSKSYIFKNQMNYFLKLLSALIGAKSIFTKKFFRRFSLQSKCNNFNQWEHWIYNRSCWRELGGGIALFCCQKWVGGLDPFGPALKKPPHPSF